MKTMRPVVVQGHKCDFKRVWLWVRFPLEEIKYLFKVKCSLFRPGVEAKRSVEFRHTARYVSRIRRKVDNGVS